MNITLPAIYLAALAATLVLAAYCTPRNWWRRLNLRAIGITLGGTLLIGHLLTQWLIPAHARTEMPGAGAVASAGTGRITSTGAAPAVPSAPKTGSIATQPFAVHRDLNLRRAAGVDAARMLIIPAGSVVTPTDIREGDWWQISACRHGQCNTGWVSSLWLRRHDEQQRTVHEH